jgi:hypothetical protein
LDDDLGQGGDVEAEDEDDEEGDRGFDPKRLQELDVRLVEVSPMVSGGAGTP